MKDAIERLKQVHPDALAIVRRVLEARACSALQKLDELELRSEVRRSYAILAELIEGVERSRSLEDADTVVLHRSDLVDETR